MAGTDLASERYARHLRLAEIGPLGQERFLAGAARIEGDGAAAEEAALYLCAAGVGRLVLMPALAARLTQRLAELNPDVRVVPAALDAIEVREASEGRRADGARAALEALLRLAGLGRPSTDEDTRSLGAARAGGDE